MATLRLLAENQIQRVNLLVNKIKKIQSLDAEILTTKPDAKTWSVVEVVGHMNIAYAMYREKIDHTLATVSEKEEDQEAFKAGFMSKLVINLIKPQNEQRKWKMKTIKKFQPQALKNDISPEEINQAFKTLLDHKAHLKSSIIQSRTKKVEQLKFTSAIGPVVKFHLPECFEFVLSHAERHVLQAKELVNTISTSQTVPQREVSK